MIKKTPAALHVSRHIRKMECFDIYLERERVSNKITDKKKLRTREQSRHHETPHEPKVSPEDRETREQSRRHPSWEERRQSH
jgi:hypothetical protein